VSVKYYEEFELGTTYRTFGRTITEADLVNFIGVCGIYEPVFQDADFAIGESPFRRRVVPGALVFSFAEGLVVQTGELHGTGLAFLGMDLKVLGATEVGDTVRVEVEIVKKRLSRTKGRGVVTTRNRVFNQRKEVVLEYSPVRLIQCRGSDEGVPTIHG
jgi:acyl dehydratase